MRQFIKMESSPSQFITNLHVELQAADDLRREELLEERNQIFLELKITAKKIERMWTRVKVHAWQNDSSTECDKADIALCLLFLNCPVIDL